MLKLRIDFTKKQRESLCGDNPVLEKAIRDSLDDAMKSYKKKFIKDLWGRESERMGTLHV